MYFKKNIFLLLFSFTLLSAQNNIGINLNNEDLEVSTSLNINNTVESYADSTAYILDASYLHTDGNDLAAIGLSGENTFQGMENLAFGFGAKFIFTDDFMAVPLFAKANYLLPLDSSLPSTYFTASFAYAPSVLSFIDAESYTEFRLEADIEIISNIHLFTGYRNIDTEYNTHDKTFNDSFYGGMKLSF